MIILSPKNPILNSALENITSKDDREDGLDAIMQALFHVSPLAYAISTAEEPSTLVRVNEAYADLVGMPLETLIGQVLYTSDETASDLARERRMLLLETTGHYSAETATMRHADGRLLSVLMSARRFAIAGILYDLKALTDVTKQTDAQKQQQEALRVTAMTDSLTGLPNKLAFDHRIDELLVQRRGTQAIAVAILDLNGFKAVNDTYGHQVGDTLLANLGTRLDANIRADDFVSRIGGDEFAFIFQTSIMAARRFEVRIVALLVRVLAKFELPETEIHIGGALGYGFASEVERSVPELSALADRRMYQAKSSGKRIAVRGP